MGYIEELAAREAARQEIGRAKQAEAARVLDQGQVGLARVMADPYAGGLSQEDAYKLQLVQKAREANAKAAYDKLAADRFNASKQYIENKKAAEMFGDVPGPDGKYKLVPVGDGRADWDAQIPGGDAPDPISKGVAKLQAYLINKPREAANEYIDNVDPGLAAKWMSSYKGR